MKILRGKCFRVSITMMNTRKPLTNAPIRCDIHRLVRSISHTMITLLAEGGLYYISILALSSSSYCTFT